MTTYVAFLRGINLGSTNKISMAELRALAEGLGYGEVRTYINSGNLIFSSTKRRATVEREVAAGLADQLGHRIDVTVRTPGELRKILTGNPYPEGDPSRVTVAFLAGPAPAGAAEKVAAVAAQHEPFTIAGTEVYVHYSQGIGTSKLAERFSAIIGVSATVRNVRTVAKVAQMCG